MLGRNIVEQLAMERPDIDVVGVTRADVDLRDQAATRQVVEQILPDTIIHAAAKVGGIGIKLAEPTPFLLDNLQLDSNVISAALDLRIPELLYIGSAAVFPAAYERPYVEADMLTGSLEPANEGYAIAKIAAAKVCEYASRQFGLAYRVAQPSNLYGVHDHFELSNAHLIGAALAKVHAAHEAGEATVGVWGDGTARREFTFASDLAGWLAGQIGQLSEWPPALNLGCGEDHSIADYYRVASEVIGFAGGLDFNTSKPAGVPRRLLDSTAARSFGWNPSTSLADGMAATYADYLGTLRK